MKNSSIVTRREVVADAILHGYKPKQSPLRVSTNPADIALHRYLMQKRVTPSWKGSCKLRCQIVAISMLFSPPFAGNQVPDSRLRAQLMRAGTIGQLKQRIPRAAHAGKRRGKVHLDGDFDCKIFGPIRAAYAWHQDKNAKTRILNGDGGSVLPHPNIIRGLLIAIERHWICGQAWNDTPAMLLAATRLMERGIKCKLCNKFVFAKYMPSFLDALGYNRHLHPQSHVQLSLKGTATMLAPHWRGSRRFLKAYQAKIARRPLSD